MNEPRESTACSKEGSELYGNGTPTYVARLRELLSFPAALSTDGPSTAAHRPLHLVSVICVTELLHRVSASLSLAASVSLGESI